VADRFPTRDRLLELELKERDNWVPYVI